MTPQEEGIHELMDTIASKTLAGEISKEETVELLSDLMATNMMDKVVPADEIGVEKTEVEEPQIISTQEITIEERIEQPTEELPKEEESTSTQVSVQELETASQEEVTQTSKAIDNDFYTKSMDLSTKDLEMADDFEEKGLPTIVKVLIAFLIISIIAVAAYFVYLKLK